jgi:hypothetical protein
MNKANTVKQVLPHHTPAARAHTQDTWAARAVEEAVKRKRATEAKLAEFGLKSRNPVESLVG